MRQTHEIFVSVGNALLQQLYVLRLDTEQSINKIPTAKLVLSLPARARMDIGGHPEAQRCQPGKTLNITLDEHDGKTLFKGVIVTSEFSIEREETLLTLHLKHALVALTNTLRSHVYQDMTDADIVTHLCGQVNNQVMMTMKHEQKVQYRCSDWTMLTHCLDANNAWLIAEPEVNTITEPKLMPVVPFTHRVDAESIVDVSYARWRFSALDQPKTMTVSSWDVMSQKVQSHVGQVPTLGSGALEGADIQGLNEEPWEINYSSPQTESEIRARADRLSLLAQLERVQGQLELDGTLGYALGDTLEIAGFGKSLDGKGIVTSISHRLTPSMWKTDIKMGLVGGERYASPLPEIHGVHIGIVGNYEKRADELYRIHVHIPAFSNDNNKNKVWARFAMPYASNEGGLYCYPEPGDEVLLKFIENNPSYPVIIGALHNPKNKPFILPEEQDHHIKGWRTNHKNGPLFFHLNADSQTVRADIGDSSVLIMDPRNGISLMSKKKIDIASDDVVNMKSKEAFNIESNDGVGVTATKEVSVESTASIKLTAPEIQLKKS